MDGSSGITYSGGYAYIVRDRPVAIVETFEVSERADGIVRVTASRDEWRTGDTSTITTEIRGRRDETHELTWTPAATDGATIRARYVVAGDVVRASRSTEVDGWVVDEPEEYEVALAPDAVVIPQFRLYMGRLLCTSAARGGREVEVLVPWVKDPGSESTVLVPRFEHRSARLLATDDEVKVPAGGGSAVLSVPARRVAYVGEGVDATGAACWVDESGLLVRYAWGQPGDRGWDVRLADVVGDWAERSNWLVPDA
jgi:hypothetical protein